MAIQFACPICRTSVEFDLRYAGCAMNCLHCNHSLMVPMQDNIGSSQENEFAIASQPEALGFLGTVSLFSVVGVAAIIFCFLFKAAGLNYGLSPVASSLLYLMFLGIGFWAGLLALYRGEGRRTLILTCLLLLLGPLMLVFLASTYWLLEISGALPFLS